METRKDLITRIDKVTEDFINSFGSLTQEQLNWKPNPQVWSIAQIIDHLIIVNETYFPIIESIRKGTYKLPFISRIGFAVSLLGKIILKSVQPDRSRKMKTFSIWEPGSSQIPANILDRFKRHQEELKTLVNNSRDLINKGTIISSPANRNIVYTLETSFEIIVTHEQRHFNQAKEVLKMLDQ